MRITKVNAVTNELTYQNNPNKGFEFKKDSKEIRKSFKEILDSKEFSFFMKQI
jgi:hypothetical protein